MDQDTNTSHSQAVDIGQALLTAGLMSAVSGHQQFSDGSELYLPTYNPDTAEADLKDEPDNSPQGHSDIIEPAWLRDLPNISVIDDSEEPKERPVKRDSTKDRKGSDQGDSGLLEELRHSVRKGRQAEESLDQSGLDEVYRRHEAEYLLSLLRVESIPTEWTQTICQLADVAVTTVKPDVRYSNDEMDILAYVKVKCVSGGRREESRMVEGEVCSLQLTHKDMATAIPQPRIALVEESIMFKDRNTMVSLETVTLQEAEYVKNVIAKLLDLKPSLVLVEKSVANLAQDILLKEGVSLAVNVKPKVLSRLARLTQGSIIKSVDTLITVPRLGTCGQVSSELTDNKKRLLVFDGCSPALGGTVLLRGGDRRFLSKVKAVLRRLILIKYNWQHERSLLVNEYGSILESTAKEVNFEKYHLSISPFIHVEKTENENDVPFAVEVTDDSVIDNDDTTATDTDEDQSQFTRHPWCETFVSQKITSLTDSQLRDRAALFRAAGWRLHHATKAKVRPKQKFCCVLPEDHTETLPVQFSMFSKQSRVAPNYCVPPWVLKMHLYSENDMSLGEFLDTLCFSSDYVCPNTQCSTPPILHTRRHVEM